MRMNYVNYAAALSATLLALAPAAVGAAPNDPAPFSETVAHDDLDLTTPRGIALLEARIDTRVNRLCATGGRDFASLRLERECRRAALTRAEGQVRLTIAEANADRVRLAEVTATSATDTPGG